jgi:hypothetical protein
VAEVVESEGALKRVIERDGEAGESGRRDGI